MTAGAEKPILFVLGSRGEWGYIRPIIMQCRAENIAYSICVTNMVLLANYGRLIDEIEAEGFEVAFKLNMAMEGDSHQTMAKSLGIFMQGFVDLLATLEPKWVLLAGDRGEQLMASIAAAYMYIPCAHIQAGERSGNIDGTARHAIARFAHIHFAANLDAASRLERQGEERDRIFNVGAPQLDEIHSGHISGLSEIEHELRAELPKDFVLVVNHGNTEELEQAEEQMSVLVRALNKLPHKKIAVLPNNDAGSGLSRRTLMANRNADWMIFSNLSRATYLGLLERASLMIGNSSSGLLEAPSFRLPVINLGRRQDARVRGKNVIDSSYSEGEIEIALQRALSKSFRESLVDTTNPYGDGQSGRRILRILSEQIAREGLTRKNVTY